MDSARLVPRIIRLLWGDLTHEELKKFGILAFVYFLIIGAYALLRSLKDPLFALLVGYRWQPTAKLASLVMVAFAVVAFSKLVDRFQRHTLFYIVCSFFGIGFVFIAYAIAHPQVLAAADLTIAGRVVVPGHLVGWLAYIFLETYGSIAAALFWGFVASTTSPESAKRGYGMILAFTQCGAMLGPWLVLEFGEKTGLPFLYGGAGVVVCCVPFLIMFYRWVVPYEPEIGATEEGRKVGVFEGMRLLVSHPYLMGVFVVGTMYEVISTITEYEMSFCASQIYPAELDGGIAFAWFTSWNNFALGSLSFLFALFGTSFLLRRLGLLGCLVLFPVMIISVSVAVWGVFAAGCSMYVLMWSFFVAVVLFKSFNYTLNNPSKEMLYIPTSRNIKFKTKGWIDAVGARSLKGVGALITGSYGSSIASVLPVATVTSLVIGGGWVFVAVLVGMAFERLQAKGEIIE
jgi:ATP:ADP antiporter, AAA family